MTSTIRRTLRILAQALASAAMAALLAVPALAVASEGPVKEVLASRIGRNVDKTKEQGHAPQAERDICTVASKDECQPATPGNGPGEFEYPEGAAGVPAPNGDVYIADRANNRVQELTATGEFVLTFGWNVDRTKIEKSAPQAERNLCTATSKDICQAGEAGAGQAEQMNSPASIAVDPASHDIYVQDFYWRVDRYSSEGKFVLTFGKEVDKTKKGDICTAASGDICQEGVRSEAGSTEPGAFKFAQFQGNLLSMGGPEDLVYVGDEGRVQEFEADGKYKQEIQLAAESEVSAIALENNAASPEYGYLHLTRGGSTVYTYDTNGKQATECAASAAIRTIAIDGSGRLAASAIEEGLLLDAKTCRPVTRFSISTPFAVTGVGFNGSDDLYAATVSGQEILAYIPQPVGEPATGSVECRPGADRGTDATVDCSLDGEINSWGVPETETWFQWGRTTALGGETSKQPACQASCGSTPTAVNPTTLEGLRPHEVVYDRLAAYDQNVKSPEIPLTGETVSIITPSVPPRPVGQPNVLFAGSFSAVMFGELNPENTNTSYMFEYGPCGQLEGCSEISHTAVLGSALYGKIDTTLEATDLRADTSYSYRLVAINELAQQGQGPEGTFTTMPVPVPQAASGPPSEVGTTSAIISGTVNPGGQPATYTFELGIGHAESTQYATVFSGSAGASTTAIEKTLALTGLQPGTEYAYKITVKSGYGTAEGQPEAFTTAGLPAILPTPAPLAMLATPRISFPKTAKAVPRCKQGYTRGKNNKCVKARKKAKLHRKVHKGK